jgi:hypothetical protein
MSMPITVRDRRFNMLLSEDEETMLRELAEEQGVSASDVVRTLVRNAHRSLHAISASATKARRSR